MRNHGGQIQALAMKHGISLPAGKIFDFSASLSPLGMPPKLQEITDLWQRLANHYPSPDAEQACTALASAHDLLPKQVLCGNGSTELFALSLSSFGCRCCTVFPPCWSGYREACDSAGIQCIEGSDWNSVADGDAMIVASPNNPNGALIDLEALIEFCRNRPNVLVLVDLAFDDFISSPQASPWWSQRAWPCNLVRIKSLTKFFGIPGIRLGFLAIGNGDHADHFMETLRKRVLPWNVNSLAQWSAEQLYLDKEWMDHARTEAQTRKASIVQILKACGYGTTPCAAWIYATPPKGISALETQKALLQQGICVRVVHETHLRFGLPSSEAVSALKRVLLGENKPLQTKSILVAGSTSDAGKSILATGLCAVLHKYGYNPAPFKAQNMSNHAWVTPEGGEIGWAQAVQAFAAGLSPHTDMNPVLLKPGDAHRSHVILNGIDSGSASVQEYHSRFTEVREVALDAYDRIAKKHGIIVLEGAGGISEINLRHRDLSNREVPLHANAKIVIVGDIERGGVFASLYGSWILLEEEMRSKVAGFVINRFRGDESLLASGITELQQRTGVPVLGVLPYVPNLQIGQEDSLGFDEEELPSREKLRIGVIRLPHLSNGNDWMVLKSIPELGVFCSSDQEKLAQADVLIVPGTRSTIADLRWLREQRIDHVIESHSLARKPLFAICGGMQMLGKLVEDPEGVEGNIGESMQGLGIFPIKTTLHPSEKTVRMRHTEVSSGVSQDIPWLPAGTPIHGFEIHCGQSLSISKKPPLSWLDGWMLQEGRIWGTYWHDILNHRPLLQNYIEQLWKWCKPSHPTPVAIPSANHFLQEGIEQVCSLVENHLDWKRLL